MRIVWLSHFLPWPATGHGALARSYHLVRETAQRHDLHLVALAPPNAQGEHSTAALDAARQVLEGYCASVSLIPIRQGAGRRRRAGLAFGTFFSSASYWEHWYYSPVAHDVLIGTLERVQPELVHVDTIFLRPYLASVGAPLALHHHNLESHLLTRRASSVRAYARPFFAREAAKVTRAEQLLTPRAAVNVMVSPLDAKRLGDIAPGVRTAVVANGVDLDFFRLPPVREANPRELVFLGGMDWFPNRDAVDWFLTNVWPLFAKRGSGERLTVVGRHPSPALREAAAADPRITTTGFVEDVRPYVARAAIFICPIRVGGGTRLKILDALAMGRVLISTAVGVEGIPAIDGWHYLRAETPADFVAQIDRAAQDANLRDRLGAAGRELVEEQFGWKRLGERLDQAYRECLA